MRVKRDMWFFFLCLIFSGAITAFYHTDWASLFKGEWWPFYLIISITIVLLMVVVFNHIHNLDETIRERELQEQQEEHATNMQILITEFQKLRQELTSAISDAIKEAYKNIKDGT